MMRIAVDHGYPSRRSPLMADNVVATSHPLAAQAGLMMLARGGNAVDAAIAGAAVLTLVEPTGCGLGSDAFAILWDGERLHGLNASGRAPQAWTPERFAGRDEMPIAGWESVTVPGAVSAWVDLSDRFGKLPFAELLEPAIRYARSGFEVTPKIADLWAKGAAKHRDQPGFAETFLRNGQPPKPGERFFQPDLAETLTAIAETKGRAFYEGALAEKIAAEAARHGAALTLEDMKAHRNDWCGTISRRFGEVSLHEIPPNGQGIAALMALGILEHTAIRDHGPDSVEAAHLQIEAIKIGFRDAWHYVADPDHMAPVSAEDLLDDAYLKARAGEIDPHKAQDFGVGAPKAGGTVYLTAGDAEGMMISFIQSNYKGFGAGVAIPGTGIHMQNRGYGFSLDPASQNHVAGGKRPFHTIIPGFLMGPDGPVSSFGVMGGPMQAQGHVQITLRTQLWGQDPQMAADAPRWRVGEGLSVACEDTMAPALVAGLQALGHELSFEAPDAAFGFGGAQIVQKLPSGGYIAGTDPRKDGAAVGF